MSREVDLRDFSISKLTSVRVNELQAKAASLSGFAGAPQVTIAKFDDTTGNPSLIRVGSVPASLGGIGNYIQRSLEFLQGIKEVLGLAASQPAEFEPDPIEQKASSGATAVHLQQKYKGIPIFLAAQTVRFAPNGALTETAGSSITVPQETLISSKLSLVQVVLRAAMHCAVPTPDEIAGTDPFGVPFRPQRVDLTGFEPKIVVTFPEKPDQPSVLEAGPFGDETKASLIWFDLDRDLRLAWEVVITMPQFAGQFRTLVDAGDGKVLYCRNLVQSVLAQGNVYLIDGDQERRMTKYPKRWEEYGLPVPDDLRNRNPDDWVGTDGTSGNCVTAHLGDSGPGISGTIQNGILTFNPAEPFGDDQKVLNIFYYNCYMHDFSYLLGFREANGNFQVNNFDRGGLPNDAVEARAYSAAVWGTANFLTPVDGSSPTMNMGLVTSTNRHTAFDASVVFHEFTHGITNRLVGGPMNTRALEAPQSSGMGEGWSDYIACSITGNPIVGAWVAQNPAGIRQFPYDTNFPAHSDNFGSLGSGRYTEVHNIGEIWCATLMEMTRNFATRLGIPRGMQFGMQLVIDALKLTPANPSFLDSRDALLTALEGAHAAGQVTSSESALARDAIWAAFAKFGMGPGARCNGATLSGIVADLSTPPDSAPPDNPPPQPTQAVRREVSPALSIPDNNPVGVLSTIVISELGRARDIRISIDISHTYVGDLQVAVVAPSGQWVILHDRLGGEQRNLIATYDPSTVPALAGLLDKPVQGNWLLGVRDIAAKDSGILNKWILELNIVGGSSN